MRISPEFIAVAVWSLFVTSIVVVDTAETQKQPVTFASVQSNKVMTGRSVAADPVVGVYGALFVDPTLQQTQKPVMGPKPTSADLTAK